MIIEIKDKLAGTYSMCPGKKFNHTYRYMIDTEKIAYISDESWHEEKEVECCIHFINGEELEIYNHSYEDVVNVVYETRTDIK